MTRRRPGKGTKMVKVVTLPARGRHVFCYLADPGQRFNDPDAHGDQATTFGGDDLRPST